MERENSRINYKELEGISKKERKETILKTGLLDKKRFTLNPEHKETVKAFHRAIKELSNNYPEIISVGLVGSATKGYANQVSDVDYFVFIDKEKSIQKLDPTELLKKQEIINRLLKTKYEKIFKENLAEKSNLPIEKLHLIEVMPLNENLIKNWIAQHNSFYYELSLLFTLQMGSRNIEQYRKIVFDELEKLSDEGENIWQNIMTTCLLAERGIFLGEHGTLEIYTNLYPQTIKEARKVFLASY